MVVRGMRDTTPFIDEAILEKKILEEVTRSDERRHTPCMTL
jgi:hypothetical protein